MANEMNTTLQTIEARVHAENTAAEVFPGLSWKLMTDAELYTTLGFVQVGAIWNEDQIKTIQAFRQLHKTGTQGCGHSSHL